MKEKSCSNCIYSGTYTVYEYPVCWLLSDDEVMFLDSIEEPCEDYEERTAE